MHEGIHGPPAQRRIEQVRRFIRGRLDPAGRYGLRLTLFAIGALLLAWPFAFLVVNVVQDSDLTEVDHGVASAIRTYAGDYPALVGVARVLSMLGIPVWFYVLVGAVSIWLWRLRLRRLVLYVLLTCAVGGVIDILVKMGVNRERPETAAEFVKAIGRSFPSGHAMMSTVVYGTLLLVLLPSIRRGRRWMPIVATIALVLAIGVSRLILGVHFLSDVLGGYVLGIAWVTLSTAAFSIWRVERGRTPVHPAEGVRD